MGNRIAQRLKEIPDSATVRMADLVTEKRRLGQEILDFSAGRAHEDSPQYIVEAATSALRQGDTHQTQAQGKRGYREKIADKLRRENGLEVDPDQEIMATMGCKNGLTLALMALVDPGDEVIVEDPCFVSYGATIRACGGRQVPVPLLAEDHFRWRAEHLEAAITKRSKCLLYCSPQNPTGTVHTRDDLELIAAIADRHDLWIVVDEIYERVTWQGRRHTSIWQLPGMRERAIGLMGFTKTFSMGGWRVGFSYAPKTVLPAMITLQQHLMTCAGSFTQTGAAAAIRADYPAEVYQMWQDWEKRCDVVTERINQLPGLSCLKPEGGFYAWIDIRKTGISSEQFVSGLLQDKNVALVAGSAFGVQGEGYVRMTCVKSWEDLHEGLHRIEAWLAGQ